MYMSSKCFARGPGGESDEPPHAASVSVQTIRSFESAAISGPSLLRRPSASYHPGTMTALLAVDVGNTNTVLGVYQDDALVASWRIQTVAERTADEYAVTL